MGCVHSNQTKATSQDHLVQMKSVAFHSGTLTSTRQTLLSRLKNWEDQASWREFFDLYWKLIYGVALQAGLAEAEAQDVVQETLIAVAKAMLGFKYDRAGGSFKGWLLQLTRWKITDQFRKRRPADARRPQPVASQTGTSPIERIPDPASLPLESVWDREWNQCLLEQAMERIRARVPPKQYQIFDLYAVKRWPVEKVAAALHVNPGQVYLIKHRVGALIKKEVRKLETQPI